MESRNEVPVCRRENGELVRGPSDRRVRLPAMMMAANVYECAGLDARLWIWPIFHNRMVSHEWEKWWTRSIGSKSAKYIQIFGWGMQVGERLIKKVSDGGRLRPRGRR